MHLHFRNVNEAFRNLTHLFNSGKYECCEQHNPIIRPIVRKSSRNGAVLMIEEPVTITYSHPRERVLFNSARDANPFFHLFEGLWMLAGRNDLAPLQYYVSTFDQFSDDGKTLNGAYGYRWRHQTIEGIAGAKGAYYGVETTNVDQLDLLVNHLKAMPNSRRAVLTMWDVEDDLLKVNTSRDTCCNLNVMFALRTVEYDNSEAACDPNRAKWRDDETFLDMTVTNRSNDMILGMLGANYVHFTMLQEYMAARLGVEVGKYHHITNNLHVYTNNWEPEKWLAPQPRGICKQAPEGAYPRPPIPLVKDPAVFEQEMKKFVDVHDRCDTVPKYRNSFSEPFLNTVATPAMYAFHHHKIRDYVGALYRCAEIKADDWRIACTQWIEKRKRMYENRKGAGFTQGAE